MSGAGSQSAASASAAELVREDDADPGVPALHLIDAAHPDEPAGRGWPIRRGDLEVVLRISVVIPCVDEALNLPSVLSQMPSKVGEVILVDGWSTDGTVEISRDIRPDVIVVQQDRTGKGDALKAGFEMATGDIIVMMDGDGSMSPREIEAMVNALVAGADVVKGSRNLDGGHSADLTRTRDLGNRALSVLFNAIYDADHTDLCYGYMAFWRRHLWALSPSVSGFEVETFLNVRASRAGLKVVEVASKEGRRLYGNSNLHPIRDGLRIVRTMFRERIAPRPVLAE